MRPDHGNQFSAHDPAGADIITHSKGISRLLDGVNEGRDSYQI